MSLNIGQVVGDIIFRDRYSAEFNAAISKAKSAGEQLSQVGSTLTKTITLPFTAAAGASLKFATDFESSFTGVRKTVDATEPEFQALAQAFRDMAKEIPINVNEINRIGEAAGQLGIENENLVEFVRTMADLGVTTDLTSDQAASALARLANITQMPQTEFRRLGSTVVDLGNRFATTESQIVEMALRLAGSGKQVGLTEGQILGFATALSSVGIQAEAGGSAFSKVFEEVAKAVAVGGEQLELFASVAGKSAGEFADVFRTDAAGAIEIFVNGLANMQGGSDRVILALSELGIEERRMRDALSRLSGAGDLLNDTLDRQAIAWEEGTALAKEAELRYKTFESQLTIFWNRLKDIGITLGTAFIPALKDVLDLSQPLIAGVAKLAEKFAQLPTPIKLIVAGLGGLAAAAGPVLFVTGQLISAWTTLAASTIGASLIPAIKALLVTLTGPVGLAVAAGAILLSFKPVRDFLSNLASNVLSSLRTAVTSTISTIREWWQENDRLHDAISILTNGVKSLAGEALKRVIDAVDDVISVFNLWWNRTEDVRKILLDVVKVITSPVVLSFRLMLSAVETLIISLAKAWTTTGTLREFLLNLATVISRDVLFSISAFIKSIVDTVSKIADFISAVRDNIKIFIEYSDIADRVRDLMASLSSEVRIVIDWVSNLASRISTAVVTAFRNFISALTDNITTFIQYSDIGIRIRDLIASLASEVRILRERVVEMVGGWQGMASSLAAINPILAAFVGKMIEWSAEAANATNAANDNVLVLRPWKDRLAELKKELEQNSDAGDELSEAVRNLTLKVKEGSDSFPGLTDEVEEFRGVTEELVDMTKALDEEFRESFDTLGDLRDAYDILNEIMSLNAGELDKIGPLTARFNELLERLGEESEDTAKDLEEKLARAFEILFARMDAVSDGSTPKVTGAMKAISKITGQAAEDISKTGDSFLGMRADTAEAISGMIQDLQKLSGAISFIFGENAQKEFDTWTNIAIGAFDTVAAFAKGDFLNGIIGTVNTIVAVWDSLFPSSKTVEERLTAIFDKFDEGTGTIRELTAAADLLVRVMERVTEGTFDAAHAARIVTDNFDEFVEAALTLGDEGLQAISRVVQAAEASGVGLEAIAERLAEAYEEAFDIMAERAQFLEDQAQQIIDGLTAMIGTAGDVTSQEIEFAAQSILQAFAAMVEAGIPVSQALDRIGELFGDINAAGIRLGADLGPEFARLGEIIALLSDPHLRRVIERLEGMTAAAEAAGNLGLLTTDQFIAMTNRIVDTFNQLIESGLTAEETYGILAGPLQTLLDLSQQYGFAIDENAQALLDEALALGLVADRGLTTEDILMRGFDRMLEGINRLIIALGGIPVAFESWTNSGRRAVDNTIEGFDRLGRHAREQFDDIGNSWSRTADGMIDDMDRIEREGRNAFDSIADEARDSFDDVADSARSTTDQMIDHFQTAADEIDSILAGIGPVNIPAPGIPPSPFPGPVTPLPPVDEPSVPGPSAPGPSSPPSTPQGPLNNHVLADILQATKELVILEGQTLQEQELTKKAVNRLSRRIDSFNARNRV